MKLYENERTKFLKEKLNEGSSEAGPPPELFIEGRCQTIAEKKYLQYLTDRKMQAYNYEIFMLMNTATSIQYKYDGETFVLLPLFTPDRTYEIKRIMDMRDEYLRLYYPEIIMEEEKIKNEKETE